MTPAAGKNLRLHLAALLLFAALAAILTWPTVIRPRDYVISEYMDAATAFENLWWFEKAVELRVSPWQNPLLDYPDGYSMIFFPMWIPYDLVGLPVVRALGPDGLPIAFNLVSLLSFVLAGWAGFLLVRYITNDAGAALVAGAALEALPYRLWNITRWHVSCLELIALLLYFFLRLVRERDRRAAIGFALSAAALAYMSPNYTADLAMGLTIALPLFLFFDRDPRPAAPTLWRPLFLAVGFAALLCAPLLVRIGLEIHGEPVPLAQTDAMRIPYSANLLGFITPGWNLRALGSLGLHFPYPDAGLARNHGISGYELFCGFTVLGLAAVGLVRAPRRAAPLAILAAVFVTLALGPRFHFGAHTFNLSGPYSWLEPVLPWLHVDRTPARHAGLAYVCMIAMAGLGLASVRAALPGRRIALAVLAGAAILLEFNQAPLSLSRFPVPAYVFEIKADPVFGSVLDLPYLPDLKRIGGYYQMFHGKPLAYQLTSRIDDPAFQAGPLFRWLDHPRVWLKLTGPERDRALAALRAEMARRKLRYLVAYPKFMEPDDLAGLAVALDAVGPHEVLRKDGLYWVYRYPVK